MPDAPALHALVIPPREPSSGPTPVLLMVHGVGSNERDLALLAPRLDGRFAIHSLRAPIVMGPDAYGWFSVQFTASGPVHDPAQAETARLALVRYVKTLKKDPKVGPVYLLGFSQGCILGLSLVHTEPELLAGVVAISGRTLPESAAASKKPGRSPPVLLLHGTRDAKLPHARGVESKALLEAAGREVEFKSYDAGHEINAQMLGDLAAWLSHRL